MDVVRTISRSGNNETHNNNDSETDLSVNPHAAVVPNEDTVVAPASAEDSNTNASDANNHAAVAVVVENPSEREERKEAVADDIDDDSEGDSEDEDEYEYEEDEDEAAFSSFLVDQPALTIAASATASTNEEQPTKIEEDEVVPPAAVASARSWREPSREAVTMSLRAEKETSGSKRRLAQDLYRIMNKDTSETGFMLEPAVEDQMDQWKICLFQFDEDSMLAKDLAVLGVDSVELEMSFPEQYPFSPPFVRVVRPRFKRQTGFVMNGALCMELLTSDGWNPVNDIESVIVSIRSLLVVGEGRLEAASNMSPTQYAAALEAARSEKPAASAASSNNKKRLRTNSAGDAVAAGYSVSEAKAAYEHLSSYHKKKGWDQSGWWAKKG
uniref:UBC core domain-containing protein n=1 Tax=Amphora coffeiformis TaxID=265554 RepID=A0A7S3L5E8_9STRA|mmetsp:Transcript_14817/g.28225  ORF Transcript_14817/g.28225 Transcript_14817/m.28225 type:complete len:384 (+) Transcript_14817:121-1272(+)|eukprot:scaffold2028_cov191-Amphora_coffeaeformis.AAC.2